MSSAASATHLQVSIPQDHVLSMLFISKQAVLRMLSEQSTLLGRYTNTTLRMSATVLAGPAPGLPMHQGLVANK